MAGFKVTSRLLNITPDFCLLHNHRLDAAFTDRYIVRLPDGTPVAAAKYEERRRDYEAAQARKRQDNDTP